MGDRALLVELGDEISPQVNERLRELLLELERQRLEGLLDVVPGYRSLVVIYDPLKVSLPTLRERIAQVQKTIDRSRIPEPKLMKVPVVYGGGYGPDLEWVADYCKISSEEVVRLHTVTTYRVYMIGFMPGYPYMGDLPEALLVPRKETPRTVIPQGSVGIAQNQTGIYPAQSPGGWQIIGQTPLKLFDPAKQPPALLEMGDMVQFYPIDEEEMAQWEG